MSSTTNSPSGGVAGWLADSRRPSGMLLGAAATAVGALATFWGYTQGLVVWPQIFWAAIVALALLGASVWQLGGTPVNDRYSAARVLYLALTGVIGCTTVFYGLIKLFGSWDKLAHLFRDGEREGLLPVLLAVAAIIVGLMVMFHGLQVARVDERRSVVVRRSVYGMNAVLSGFLLLVVLSVGNVLAYLKLPGVVDATRSGMYSLSDRSVKLLKELDRPVKVYLLMRPGRQEYEELRSLLTNCQEKTNRINFETIDPSTSAAQIKDLGKKYPQIMEDTEGVLVVAGEEKSDNSAFIRARDLISVDSSAGQDNAAYKFQGEVIFFTELVNLLGGKEKIITYVLQGNGEPDLESTQRRPVGIGILRERLQRRNFDMRSLKLDPTDWKIPDDAKIVIVAGAKKPYPPFVADGLRAHLDRGGKLVAFLDPIEEGRSAKSFSPTGLESLFAAYGIEVTNQTIFGFELARVGEQVGLLPQLLVEIPEAANSLPLATPFIGNRFNFTSFRLLKVGERGSNPMISATPFLVTSQGSIFAESDPQISLAQTAQSILQGSAEARNKLLKTPQPFEILVTKSPPPNPHEPAKPASPAMAVFAESSFLINDNLAADINSGSSLKYDLVASTMEWLRGRTSNIGLDPRTYQNFELKADASTRIGQILFLPLLVALLGIAGMGLGVWIIRRQ